MRKILAFYIYDVINVWDFYFIHLFFYLFIYLFIFRIKKSLTLEYYSCITEYLLSYLHIMGFISTIHIYMYIYTYIIYNRFIHLMPWNLVGDPWVSLSFLQNNNH